MNQAELQEVERSIPNWGDQSHMYWQVKIILRHRKTVGPASVLSGKVHFFRKVKTLLLFLILDM